MAKLQFQDSWSKLEWSKSKINDLNRMVNDFIDSDPVALERCRDLNRKDHHIIRLKAFRTIPDEVVLQFSDICFQLRSPLDYLACRLTELNGEIPNSRTQFPFAGSLEDLESLANKKIRHVSSRAREMILALKPYKGGNNLLYALHELNRTDKHVRLSIPAYAMRKLCKDFSVSDTFNMCTHLIGSLEEGIPLLSLPQDAEFKSNMKITYGVTLNEVEAVKGQPIGAVAIQLCNLVEGILNIFETEDWTAT